MTIFGFAKYLAARLVQQPSVKDGPKPYTSNAGNIFFALFAAVGMVGAVGYGFNSVLRGPVSAMTETTRRTVAESTVITSSRLAIVGATTQQASSGDVDADGMIEPVPYRNAGAAAHPTGGGYLPTELNIPNTIDPWLTEYGYCAWNHGTNRAATTGRLAGSPNNNRFAIAIISAGKDKRFQTSCVAYVDDNTVLVQRTPGSDDIVLAYTYAEANDLGNGLWRPATVDPEDNAVTDKNIEVTKGGVVSGAVTLSGNTATGGGLILPSDPGDDSVSGVCDATNDLQLRYNISDPGNPPVIEICDDGGLGWSPVSGGAGGGGGNTTGQLIAHYKFDEISGTVAHDETGDHDGTLVNSPTWAPGQGKVGGALLFSHANDSFVEVPNSPALEPSAVTFSAWIKPLGMPQAPVTGIICKILDTGANLSWGMEFAWTSGEQVTFWTADAHNNWQPDLGFPTTMPADNTWIHLTAVIDPTGPAPQKRLYFNGVLVDSATVTTPLYYGTDGLNLEIGSNKWADTEFNGYMDDVRIYNYGLTDAEVMELYSSVSPASLNLDAPQKAGAVYSWGNDPQGKLGNGPDEAGRTAPGPALSTNNFIDVDGGTSHGCGVKSDGTAWCWGSDTNGKLGNGGGVTADQQSPYQVTGLSNVVKISAGEQHTCALRNDGAVYCWGLNTDGRLGDGTTVAKDAPVRVLGVSNVIDVSAGSTRTCAVLASGTAYCWGLGTSGQLGTGASASSSVPLPVATVSDFTQISVGEIAADDPTCGVTRSGKAYCWGADTSEQLGNGAGNTSQMTPGEVVNTSENFSKISVNDNTVCALVAYAQNAVACWGQGGQGQNGSGTPAAATHTPTFVSHITGIIDVAVGNNSVCAVEATGNVWCWGEDHATYGRLGNGEASNAQSNAPVLAKAMNAYRISGSNDSFYALIDTSLQASAASPQYAKRFSSGAAESNALHSCHIRSDGTMWCWGLEHAGELGNGGGLTDTAASPVRVTDPGPWMSVTVGEDHTCGIKVDGSAWCWGSDASGQLGNGATAGSQASPSAITSTVPWTQLSALSNITCGIKADGTAYCWGDDTNGKLGNGAGGSATAPGTAITSSLAWIQISAGGTSCGIKSDNTLWCWGDASLGGLGNGTTSPNLESPVQIGTDTWRYVDSTGPCGIKTDGSLWCWGWNTNGKLGIGTSYTGDQSVPRLVVEPGPWASVKAGSFSVSCGVKMDGTGWCWGNNDSSLGIGSVPAADVNFPVPVVGTDWAHIDNGGTILRCGSKNDDSVWCWGNDFLEVLGNGAGNVSSDYPQRIYQPYKSPFQLADATTTSYAAAPVANLAIGTTPLSNAEGTVQGLSFPGSGRTLLTQATTANQLMLETSMSGGAAQVWLNANSLPYYMGYNAYTGGLEFGYGSDWLYSYTTSALDISNEGFTGIGTGGAPVARLDVRGAIKVGDAGSTCNASVEGTIKYASGRHYYCNGGNWVDFGTSVSTAGMKWDMERLSVDAGPNHTCGITAEGSLWCWGSNMNNRLGNGDTTTRTVPTAVSASGRFMQVTTGNDGGCALRDDHTAWCWGLDGNGALGNDPANANSAVPVQVSSSVGFVQITGHYSTNCGLRTDGAIWCWGRGTEGQRGDGTGTANAYVPVAVAGGATWRKVSMGVNHGCGIRTDGTLWCWGTSVDGALGLGALVTNTNSPQQVGVGLWADIAAGQNHTCGIMIDGTAWCWGWNNSSEIGDNTSGQRNTPTALVGSGTGTWRSIAVAQNLSCGIKTNGSAWCWGAGGSGQRGDGTTTGNMATAQSVTGGGTWSYLYAGSGHVCGIKTNGRLYCWGAAANGKLGNGTTTPNLSNPELLP